MTKLKITAIGNSCGVILPKEILAILNVNKGDTLFVSRTPKGIEITSYNDEFAHQMEVGRKIMREDRDVLKKLAE